MPRFSVPLGGGTVEVVDLTLPLTVDSPVYPGDPEVVRAVVSRLDETGFEHYVHQLGDHVFSPHADAPGHQNPDRRHQGVEVWGPAFEFNEAMLIDLQPAAGAVEIEGVRLLPRIEAAHLEPFAGDLAAVTAVVVRTGAEDWRLARRPFSPRVIPGFSAEAGAFLAAFENLRVIGTDSLSVDLVDLQNPIQTVHRAWKDRLIVESLVHLDAIPETHRKRFLLQTALVKIVGATGCPVVARAYLP